MKWYVTVKHYSVIGNWYKLNAKTALGAKREAWAKEGSGYIGHTIHIINADSYEDIHRNGNTGDFCREIGHGGWYKNRF